MLLLFLFSWWGTKEGSAATLSGSFLLPFTTTGMRRGRVSTKAMYHVFTIVTTIHSLARFLLVACSRLQQRKEQKQETRHAAWAAAAAGQVSSSCASVPRQLPYHAHPHRYHGMIDDWKLRDVAWPAESCAFA